METKENITSDNGPVSGVRPISVTANIEVLPIMISLKRPYDCGPDTSGRSFKSLAVRWSRLVLLVV